MPAGRMGPVGVVRGILTFNGSTEDVAQARRFVDRTLRHHCQRETAVLLTSEIVTNAVVHGAGPITMVVLESEAGARIEVTDAEGGRGLLLVDRLADRWDHVLTDAGLTVWFELDVPVP